MILKNIEKKFIPVMLMPFKKDLSIDYNALDELIEFYLHYGAKGLFANCLSSEMYHLSLEEMIQTVTYIIKKVDNRVPVVATGSFGDSIELQAENIKKMYATGVSAVILITSLLADQHDTESTFRNNVITLLGLTKGVPVGFYECPVPYKRILSADFLGQLVREGRVKYHKDTSLNIQDIIHKIENTVDESSFGLYDAYMVHAIDSLNVGSAGLSCIQGNYFPELIVWICNNYNIPQRQAEVLQIKHFLIENMDLMHDNYPLSAKYILSKRGLSLEVNSRISPDSLLDDETKSRLDQLIDNYTSLKFNNWNKKLYIPIKS